MIEYKYPHFLGGVSNQPDNSREEGTVHSQLNGFSNISKGLEKRTGLVFERILSNLSNPDEDYFIHWIDTTSKTFVAFLTNHASEGTVASREPIQVFDITDGTKKTINFDATYGTNQKTYLTRDDAATGDLDPSTDLKVFSIFDSTFITNSDKTTALTGIADGSTTNLPSSAAYGAAHDGTYGITNNNRVYPSYNDLPLRKPGSTNDYVANSAPTGDDYYKTLQSAVGRPAGVYQAKSSAATADVADEELYVLQITDYDDSLIDFTTMPLQLTYNEATDDFDLTFPEWEPRRTGDPTTNPGPSFIGRKIDDMVFSSDRLWIAADEFLASSQTRSYFDFWPYDALDSIETDPIDESVADEGLNKIRYMIPFNQALIVFTEGGRQFEIRSTGRMSPSSVSIIPTTSYYSSPDLRPVFLGNNLYFLSDFDNYGQLYEYYYIDNAANNVASPVTEHIPEYLPLDLSVASRDVNNGILMLSSGTGLNVYPYISKWSGDNKLQNAFSRWEFTDAGYTVYHHHQVGSQFYFLLHKEVEGGDDEWILCSLDPVNKAKIGEIPYRESLDFLMYSSDASVTTSYDSGTNTTTFTLPIDLVATFTTDSTNTNGNRVRVISTKTEGWKGFALDINNIVTDSGVSKVTVDGDWSDTTDDEVIIGVIYPWETELNLIYPKDNNNNVVSGTMTLKQLILYVRDTYFYSVAISTPGRTTPFTYDYSVVVLDGSDIQWDSIPQTETVRTQNIIYGTGHRSRIKLTDTSEFPLTIVSGEVRGVFSKTLNVR